MSTRSISFFLSFIAGIGILSLSMTFLHANSTPSVDSIVISESNGGPSIGTSIDLLEFNNKTVYVHGTYTDADDCDQVQNGGEVEFVLYRSGVNGAQNCNTDNTNCYRTTKTLGGCSISNCTVGTSTVTGDYSCNLSLTHYADATDSGTYSAENWQAWIEIADNSSASSSMSSSTEVNSLVALDLTGNISYGNIALGATSTEQSLLITNTGNVAIDSDISATNMTCDTGTILASQQHFSSLSGLTYAAMGPLSTSTQSYGLNLAKQVDATLSTTSLYFMLQAPTSSLAGTCNGTLSVTAKLDT